MRMFFAHSALPHYFNKDTNYVDNLILLLIIF